MKKSFLLAGTVCWCWIANTGPSAVTDHGNCTKVKIGPTVQQRQIRRRPARPQRTNLRSPALAKARRL